MANLDFLSEKNPLCRSNLRDCDVLSFNGGQKAVLRIVGVQRSETLAQEFILLQNQGHLRVRLRGHILMSEDAIEGCGLSDSAHVIREDEYIPPGLFVLVSTGKGTPHWGKTKDGAYVYHTYLGMAAPFWNGHQGTIHILAPHHSYCERSTEAFAMR
ncbi:MAG: hypothetical protein KF784_01615 [Fimbriimonadaceae bacterium]|nr:hypothetical protein [Fimbriimonadaceae bacterium]